MAKEQEFYLSLPLNKIQVNEKKNKISISFICEREKSMKYKLVLFSCVMVEIITKTL